MPAVAGVGFLDVGHGDVETCMARLSPADWARFVPAYFSRLAAHAAAASAAAWCACGRCGAPAVVAFAGKAQWQALFKVGGVAVPPTEYGRQAPGVRPPGWPWGCGEGEGGGGGSGSGSTTASAPPRRLGPDLHLWRPP